MTDADLIRELRAWAYGDNVREAATELLLRADLAAVDDPWIRHDRRWGIYAIDFAVVPFGRPGLSASQGAVLRLAGSLADDTHIDLHAVVRDLNYEHLLLVVTAITHAAGFHRPSTSIESTRDDAALPRIVRRPPIMNWDEDDLLG